MTQFGVVQTDADVVPERNSAKPMRIAFLMRSMAMGGAERQLTVLSRELRQRGHDVSVFLYYVGGAFDAELAANGIRVIDLKKRGRWRNFGFLMRLIRALRSERPDVLYAFLPAPNLLALSLRYAISGATIVCGVRASNASSGKLNWLTSLMLQLERRFVCRADLVIVNSYAGESYLASGGRRGNITVIGNGIDPEKFCFDGRGRLQMREAWGVASDTPVVGCVARLDPVKDHVTLLLAFARLAQSAPDVRLICVGTSNKAYASELRALADKLGVGGAVLWLAPEYRLKELYSAFDVLCLSSVTEGFPNVLAEASACGVPCVATDVGDARRILSSSDFVVPVRNPQALADALASALSQGRTFSQSRAERIRAEFSPASLAERTETALAVAAQGANARGRDGKARESGSGASGRFRKS